MKNSEDQKCTRMPICKLAFDESLKGLEIQDATLISVRQSAVVLGTFSGLVVTLLGSEVIKNISITQNLTTLDWFWPILAGASLVASIFSVYLIIKPRDGWIFHMNGNLIIEQFADHKDGPVNLDKVYGALTSFNDDNYNDNEILLKRLFLLLSILMLLLLIQIISWLMALL